ncbi:High-affinity zinc uptake system binding-protein ZnuA [bioreactor metagenome]|uniref:High-affinity zinc uptake system binding-protein ZnuA n=2 Tax=root TaxID=1 RepID=A0A644UR03_9ZZZZ
MLYRFVVVLYPEIKYPENSLQFLIMIRYYTAAMLLAVLISGSCRNQSITSEGEKIITVSTLPQKTIISEISGDKFSVNVLIPEEGNHETYEPTSRQMAETGKSIAYFKLGHLDFEINWLGKLAQNYPGMKIYDTSEDLDLIRGAVVQHGDHVHPGGVDPHIWLSVPAVKIQAGNMLKGLIELDPENAAYFTANYDRFMVELDSLDMQIRQIIEASGVREFMIYHPSLGYFARDYNLEQIAIEQEGKEPSPRYMSKLITIAREKQIRAIFVSSQFNKQSALSLASQLNARVEEFNPVDADWMKNMLDIAGKIAASNRQMP